MQCVISIKRLDAVYIFLKDWEKQVLVAWIINRNLQAFDVFIKTYNAIKGTIALFTHRPFNVFRLQNCSLKSHFPHFFPNLSFFGTFFIKILLLFFSFFIWLPRDSFKLKKALIHFPEDQELKRQWIYFLNRKDWSLTAHSFICINHFKKKIVKRCKKMWTPLAYASRKSPRKQKIGVDELVFFKLLMK